MNVLHINTQETAAMLGLPLPKPAPHRNALINWPKASRTKLKTLRALFETLRQGQWLESRHPLSQDFSAFRRKGGRALIAHATFEALHAHFYGQDRRLWHWREWPQAFRYPNGAAIRRFAAEQSGEVEFHLFLQWLAAREFRNASEAAADANMKFGIIKDIAVGADGGGSEAWSNQGHMLTDAAIGAPPDAFNSLGQNWGVTTFAPTALATSGYQSFIAVLRAALRDAGGIRIDHVLGLRRLWVVPNGMRARDGAYIRYPLDDLLHLTALEAHRADAVILGEDLGTVPKGFRERLGGFDIKGMQVLWFQRDGRRFIAPQKWARTAAAMTTTHDLPTVAGWWMGKDIVWRRRLKLFARRQDAARAAGERKRDRLELWRAFVRAGIAEGKAPPAHEPGRVVAAAISFLGRTTCTLALLPLEDALGRKEQPNLPGTIHEHPNWRRRFPTAAGDICRQKTVAVRLRRLAAARSEQ